MSWIFEAVCGQRRCRGKNRRRPHCDYETAKLSLEVELATDYFELRSADAQKQLLDDAVKTCTDNL